MKPRTEAICIMVLVVSVLAGGYVAGGAGNVALVALALLVGTRVALWQGWGTPALPDRDRP